MKHFLNNQGLIFYLEIMDFIQKYFPAPELTQRAKNNRSWLGTVFMKIQIKRYLAVPNWLESIKTSEDFFLKLKPFIILRNSRGVLGNN